MSSEGISQNAANHFIFKCLNERCFFAVDCVSICASVRRHSPALSPSHSYVLCACMSLLGRILVSVILHLPLPVFSDTFYVLDLTVVWLLVNCCAFDAVFKILSSSPAIVLVPMRAFVNVDQIVRGRKIAACLPPPGRALLSAILSSADSFVWLLVAAETREFGNRVIFRNFLAAAIDGLAVGSKGWIAAEAMRMYLFPGYVVVHFADIAWFGIRSMKGFDVTLLTYTLEIAHC